MNRPVISPEWEAWFHRWLAFYLPEVLQRSDGFELLLGVIDTEVKRRDELIVAVDRAVNNVLTERVRELEKQLAGRGWWPWKTN